MLCAKDKVIRICIRTQIVHAENRAALNKTAQRFKQNKLTLYADK